MGEAPATLRIRCTRTSTGCRSARANDDRSSATFTAAVLWRRGFALSSRSASSMRCVSNAVWIRCRRRRASFPRPARLLLPPIAALSARDRLRVACYYAQELTLAETGRVLGEHEATVSRQLAKTRRTIRHEMERYLREEGALNADQIARGFECVLEDVGPLDLGGIFRKDSASDRSI